MVSVRKRTLVGIIPNQILFSDVLCFFVWSGCQFLYPCRRKGKEFDWLVNVLRSAQVVQGMHTHWHWLREKPKKFMLQAWARAITQCPDHRNHVVSVEVP